MTTRIKFFGLMCFFSILLIFGSGNEFNISAADNKERLLDDAREALKFEAVIKKAKESVVLLSVHPNVDPSTSPHQSAMCSGVIVDDIGHIITNFHCVYKQNYIKLYYFDKDDWQEYDVNVIGLDPLADLALLQVLVREDPVPFLKFAEDAGEIAEGTEVFALGHPMGMIWTVTKGIISSNARYARHPFIKAVQTDAAINKGNSGGPLMNMKGEIVGINALIISRISENAGVAMAIRGDIVKKSFESMLDNGKVDRPAVGIIIMTLARETSRKKVIKEFPEQNPDHIPNTFGLLIRPDENIPEGLKAFDTIVGVNNAVVNDGLMFSDELAKHKIGDTVTVTIIRKRIYKKVDVKLKVFPVPVEKMYTDRAKPLPQPKKPAPEEPKPEEPKQEKPEPENPE